MKRCLQVCGMVAAMTVQMAWAQQPRNPAQAPGGQPGAGGQKQGDPLMENFFPAEALMQYATKIGLSAEQQKNIREEMQKAQVKFIDLQWQLSSDKEAMTEIIKGEKVDEKLALPLMEKLIKTESEIKLVHLTLAIHIKNALTPKQQEQLRELTQASRRQNRLPPGIGGGIPGRVPPGAPGQGEINPGGMPPPGGNPEPKP